MICPSQSNKGPLKKPKKIRRKNVALCHQSTLSGPEKKGYLIRMKRMGGGGESPPCWVILKNVIKTDRCWQFYQHFLTLLKSAIKTAKGGNFLTKSSTLLKSAIKTAEVCSLNDKSWSLPAHLLESLQLNHFTCSISIEL